MDVGLDDRTLRRTAALLVALAVLVERAASRSFPIRWLILTMLRHGEALARACVLDVTQWEWPGCDEDLAPGCGPDDAALLALRLRLLAAVLGALLRPEDRLHGDAAQIDRTRAGADGAASRLARILHVALSGGWPRRAPDTS